MEILKNIIIEKTKDTVFVYHSTSIIPNYHGTDEDTVTNISNALLEPELSLFVDIASNDYITEGETLKLIQDQNKSQSFVYDEDGNLVEMFQVITDEGAVTYLQFKNLPLDLKQSITAFGNRIISVIQANTIIEGEIK